MNEHDWLRCNKWRPMVEHLSGRVSERKARLYFCAGLRGVWHLLYSDNSRKAVEVAEKDADGWATHEEVRHACWAAEATSFGFDFEPEHVRESCDKYEPGYGTDVATLVKMGVFSEADILGDEPLGQAEIRSSLVNAAHVAFHLFELDFEIDPHLVRHLELLREWPGGWLVREIFGNPFRPATMEPEWFTETVREIGQGIYYERAFDRLPILADALEEAGCTNPDLLLHLRGPGPHARGCWALDVVLGKT